MISCVNKNTAEYQTLLKKSGLPDTVLAARYARSLDTLGRPPYLDELRGANSKPYLEELLKKTDPLTLTGKSNLKDAVISLNNNFRDVEVESMLIGENAYKTKITKRPETKEIQEDKYEHNKNANSPLMFENIIEKLLNLYGIQINSINSSSPEMNNIPGAVTSKAFVYNGQIYINTDLATKDSPIHEMMHLLIGQLRFSNPDMYTQLISSIVDSEIFKYYQEIYPFKTQSDIAEEAFVEEFSRLAIAKESELDKVPDNIKYELFYNAKRVLDTILMGETSVKDYENPTIFNKSLSELCQLVNSTLDVSDFKGTITLLNGEIHRILSNIKSDLIKNGELTESCGV